MSPLTHKELGVAGFARGNHSPGGGGVLVSIIPVCLHGGVLGDFYFGLTILGRKLSFNICSGS